MTRKFLQNLGIDTENIDKIMEANGADIEREKSTAESLREEVKKLMVNASNAKKELEDYKADNDGEKIRASLESEINALKQALGEAKKAHADEIAAHSATKETYAAEKDAEDTTALIRAALTADGANPKIVDLLLKDIDSKAVKKKDGKLENWADISKPVRERYSDFFGEVKQQGADIGSPPAAQAAENDPFLVGFEG